MKSVSSLLAVVLGLSSLGELFFIPSQAVLALPKTGIRVIAEVSTRNLTEINDSKTSSQHSKQNTPWLTAKDYLAKANAHFNKQEYKQAIEDYNQAIKINPNLAIAYCNIGSVHNLQNNYQKAIDYFNKALQATGDWGNGELALCYSKRGLAYFELKKYEQALADYNQAISLYPNLAAAYYGRGKFYHYFKKYEQALADYNQAFSLNPNLAAAGYNIEIVTRLLKNR
jgi:tetratricopeptide (TPR) repeat protein